MSPGLVARTESLTTLRDAYARMLDGRGGLVLVRGEPGIGKSALVGAFAEELSAQEASIVSGRAWELAEAPPYFPLWPCLRSLGMGPPDGSVDVYRLWEDVLARLARASGEKPVVWILEDIHAADLQSLDLLTFLTQPLHALRVLLVATTRKQDPRIDERANQRLVRMARGGIDLELAPLGEAEVAEVAAGILGRALPPTATRELFEHTCGNPLFVVECARAFRAAGAAPRSVVSLPATVRQIVIERVALLPEKTQQMLSAAAVLGRSSTAALIARMLQTLPANVIDAMLPALDAGIVSETSPGQFAFTHILVRDAIDSRMAPLERRMLHATAEAALESTGGEGAEVLVERARHALGSLRADGSAVELAQRAATMLEELGAFDRALAMHQRIDDARRAGLAPPAPMSEQLHVARIAQRAGRHAVGRQLCEEVIGWARAHQDGQLLAEAALALGAELRPGVVDPVLVSALGEARALLQHQQSPKGNSVQAALYCRVLARLAAALQPAPDPLPPIAMARDAITRARLLADDALILDVQHTALAALIDYTPSADRRELEEELFDRALRAQDLPKALRVRIVLANDQLEAGDFTAWESSVAQVLELSSRVGEPRHRWKALLLASMHHLSRGEVAAAERYVVEVQQLAALTDDPALWLTLNAHLGGRSRLLHRDAEMRELLANLESSLLNVPDVRFVLGGIGAGVYGLLEDRVGAMKSLAIMNECKVTDEYGAFFDALKAEACALVGDLTACRQLRGKLEPRASMHVVGGVVQLTYDGPVLRVLALLDSALGDHEAARRRMLEALATVTRFGFRTWVAQIHYDLGKILRQAGSAKDAAPHFATAAELAEEIGMPGLVTRARRAADEFDPPLRERPHTFSSSSAPDSHPVGIFCEGDVWRVEYAGRILRVKDNRGMQLLARLVAQPGEEIHVLTLASDDASASVHDQGGAGEVLDARARREYKQRLDELESDIAEAERNADAGRIERLSREKASLESELRRAFGLGGKARASGSASERARVNVQRRLKDAIARIAEQDQQAGRFFEKTVNTGIYCRFFV